MTLRLHISDHNDDLHNTTAKRNTAGGLAGLDGSTGLIEGTIQLNELTVTEFQTNSATSYGTVGNPTLINNGNVVGGTTFATINDYIQIIFPRSAIIKEYRQYGSPNNNGDGRWTLQYQVNGIWYNNTTNIPTRVTADWSGWTTITIPLLTAGIRFIASVIDTGALSKSLIAELEIRG